jgi:hypothetical protein
MSDQTHFRVSYSQGDRAHINELRRVFAEREKDIRERVRQKHQPHLEFLEKRGVALESLREASARKVATGALAGLMVLTPISGTSGLDHNSTATGSFQSTIGSTENMTPKLATELHQAVPAGWENLNTTQEQKISQILEEVLGVKASAEIEGHRLNRSFGLIGAEQHLYRYPGDNIFEHAKTPAEFAMFGGSGIAPGLGAYGYFAPSKAAMTGEAEAREKWYVVAQTYLAPGFKDNPRAVAMWFKYRKFIVVNPDSGQAVVGDLGDAGPAEYTGKSFGGSPEVMHELGYGAGPRKGRVLFFFLDDPGNRIPLGPISAKVVAP